MLGIHDFWLFALGVIALCITPGPDTLYIIGQSLAQGPRAGFLSMLGISSGLLIHITAASLGLSGLLARSTTAFTVVRWAGAGYLVYLGIKILIAPRQEASPQAPVSIRARPWSIYRQGFITNLLNPKVGLFFVAFLPQFVRADSPNRTMAFLLLGIAFVVTGTSWQMLLVCFAGKISQRLRQHSTFSQWLSRVTGAMLVGLGISVARN